MSEKQIPNCTSFNCKLKHNYTTGNVFGFNTANSKTPHKKKYFIFFIYLSSFSWLSADFFYQEIIVLSIIFYICVSFLKNHFTPKRQNYNVILQYLSHVISLRNLLSFEIIQYSNKGSRALQFNMKTVSQDHSDLFFLDLSWYNLRKSLVQHKYNFLLITWILLYPDTSIVQKRRIPCTEK